jgi:hypothetical protein
MTEITSASEFDELVARHDLFLFDCDGVIWHGNEPIGRSIQLIESLQKLVIRKRKKNWKIQKIQQNFERAKRACS